MKKLTLIVLAVGVMTLAVLSASFALGGASAWTPVCGPGTHWVDACGAGTDTMSRTLAVHAIDDISDGNLDCAVDTTIRGFGPTTVDRLAASDDSASFPGTRPVNGHLDVIDTEITSMTMTAAGGITLKVGTAEPTIDPAVPATLGAVAEDSGDSTLAESFFDVYFEASGIPVVGTVWNHAPLRMATPPATGIPYVPPDTSYVFTGCLALYDHPTAGSHVANLVDANHHTQEGVGGIADFPDDEVSPLSSSDASGGSSFPLAAVAGGLVALGLLAAGGFYARRRFVRS